MRILIPILSCLLLINISASSQQIQTRNIGAFDKIDVYGSIDLELKKGNKEFIEMESSNIDLTEVKTSLEGKTLSISYSGKLFKKDKQIKMTLTYRELREVKGNGGAQITNLSIFSGDRLIITEGTGSSFSSAIKLRSLMAEVGEGALISLEGTVGTQEINATAKGVYDAFGLVSDSSFVKSNTGGRCKLNVKSLIDAAASTGGYIGYKGKPKIERVKSTLGGEIKKAEESEE